MANNDVTVRVTTVAKGNGASETVNGLKKVEESAKGTLTVADRLKRAFLLPVKNISQASREMMTLKRSASQTVAEMKKSGEGINALSSALQGNFSGVQTAITNALGKTKAWQAEIARGGAGKLGAAFSIAAVGMGSLVNLAKQFANHMVEAAKAFDQGRISGIKQSVETVTMGLQVAEEASARERRKSEAGRGYARAQGESYGLVVKAEAERRRAEGVMATTDPAERERLNRNAQREVEDIEYGIKKSAADDEVVRVEEQAKAYRERMERLKEAQKRFAKISVDAAGLEQEFSKEPGKIKEFFAKFSDSWGITSLGEDAVNNVKSVEEARKAIADAMKDVQRQIKDGEAEGKELLNAYRKATNAREENENDRTAQLNARRFEDSERERGYAAQNETRAREVAERDRQNREADAEQELDHLNSMRTFQEKRQAILDRMTAREKELEKKKAELAELSGIPEQHLSEEQRRQRGWLEQDVERLTGQVRSDRGTIRQMDRQGDTEAYSRQRQYEVERRDEREADYQMLRNWRQSRLGMAGRMTGARTEYERQQGRLAESQSQMDALVRSVEKRTGQRFKYEAMTEEEKARFGDLRGDIAARRGDVRSAQGAYMEALREGDAKGVEFREGLKESNRLTALGIAGGGKFDWGRNVASNTKEMTKLLQQLVDKVEGGGKDATARYGY